MNTRFDPALQLKLKYGLIIAALQLTTLQLLDPVAKFVANNLGNDTCYVVVQNTSVLLLAAIDICLVSKLYLNGEQKIRDTKTKPPANPRRQFALFRPAIPPQHLTNPDTTIQHPYQS